MATIRWESVYKVDIKELDAQHERLVGFMNEIYDRLEQHVAVGDFSDFFRKLKSFAYEHFQTEEGYFHRFGYPGAAPHRREHAKIRKRIEALESDFEREPSALIIYETLRFLDDWLFDHTMMYDKKYTEYFRKKGLR